MRVEREYQYASGINFQISLALYSFQEDNSHIVYAPALDLSAYGPSVEAAQESFSVILEEFLRYTINKKTLIPELEKLGWVITGSKEQRKIKEPDITHLLEENEHVSKTLSDILNNKEYKKVNMSLEIPAFA